MDNFGIFKLINSFSKYCEENGKPLSSFATLFKGSGEQAQGEPSANGAGGVKTPEKPVTQERKPRNLDLFITASQHDRIAKRVMQNSQKPPQNTDGGNEKPAT